jgi:hypothetical protein
MAEVLILEPIFEADKRNLMKHRFLRFIAEDDTTKLDAAGDIFRRKGACRILPYRRRTQDFENTLGSGKGCGRRSVLVAEATEWIGPRPGIPRFSLDFGFHSRFFTPFQFRLFT